MNRRSVEAVVIGAGPAGLALTDALLSRGVDALCVAPQLTRWAPTYGAWADELVGLDVPVEHAWATAQISFPRHETVIVDREYVKLDSAALFDRWSATLLAADRFVASVVSSAFFSGDSWQIDLDSGLSIRADQLFDASGHSPQIVSRAPMSPAFQTAFGAIARPRSETLSQKTMGLMLWDNGLETDGTSNRVPAFYYTMPLSDEIHFEEYTVLSARPIVPVDRLERRVSEDLGSRRIEGGDFERCIVPMGHPIPALDQPAVGFGGAASMVHPATGYMVARTLQAAPRVAEAFSALRAEPAARRSRALWDVIWPTERVRTHALYCLGLEALLTLDVAETHEFFSAFFALPDELWRPYQSGDATVAQVATAMWEIFLRVPAPLKAKLVRAGFGHPAKLARLAL